MRCFPKNQFNSLKEKFPTISNELISDVIVFRKLSDIDLNDEFIDLEVIRLCTKYGDGFLEFADMILEEADKTE